MNEFVFEATDLAGTDRLGAALAAAMPPGTVLALVGTLGAGKTRLVQAIAAAYGVAREDVVSPTFVLCQTYEGQRLIHHLDAYRVRDADEFQELGIDELFAADGIVVVEWADRVANVLPRDYLSVEIEVTGPEARRFLIRASGPLHEATLSGMEEVLSTQRPSGNRQSGGRSSC
jgi:tRNA threonylcarbamoyladenosine biosynthesis protein TsaE